MEEIRMKVRAITVVAIAKMAILKLISIIFETIIIVVKFNINCCINTFNSLLEQFISSIMIEINSKCRSLAWMSE